ncbi:MAG: hypothetical protein ACOCYA_00160 [Spirochaetota bacterium]
MEQAVANNPTFHNWFIFFGIFMAVIAFLAIVRQIETRRIFSKFSKNDVILLTFGVNYFGVESEPGRPDKSSGALVLTKEGLYYRARYARKELFIPGRHIVKLEVIEALKGRPLNQKAVGIFFKNADGERDLAAFRIPHSAQWARAIKKLFLDRRLEDQETQ